jgi:hypothetical protein
MLAHLGGPPDRRHRRPPTPTAHPRELPLKTQRRRYRATLCQRPSQTGAKTMSTDGTLFYKRCSVTRNFSFAAATGSLSAETEPPQRRAPHAERTSGTSWQWSSPRIPPCDSAGGESSHNLSCRPRLSTEQNYPKILPVPPRPRPRHPVLFTSSKRGQSLRSKRAL